MKKLTLVSALAVLALTGASAVAQPSPHGGPRDGKPPVQRLSKEDRAALFDARMAAVPVGLKLTDAQKKLWEPVEKAMRANEAARAEQFEEMRERAAEGQRPDYLARLENGAERMGESAKRMSALSEAMKPFWASLSEDQRRLFPMLVQGGARGDKPGRHDAGPTHGTQGHGPKPAAPAQPKP